MSIKPVGPNPIVKAWNNATTATRLQVISLVAGVIIIGLGVALKYYGNSAPVSIAGSVSISIGTGALLFSITSWLINHSCIKNSGTPNEKQTYHKIPPKKRTRNPIPVSNSEEKGSNTSTLKWASFDAQIKALGFPDHIEKTIINKDATSFTVKDLSGFAQRGTDPKGKAFVAVLVHNKHTLGFKDELWVFINDPNKNVFSFYIDGQLQKSPFANEKRFGSIKLLIRNTFERIDAAEHPAY